jgi:hypothetical protein
MIDQSAFKPAAASAIGAVCPTDRTHAPPNFPRSLSIDRHGLPRCGGVGTLRRVIVTSTSNTAHLLSVGVALGPDTVSRALANRVTVAPYLAAHCFKVSECEVAPTGLAAAITRTVTRAAALLRHPRVTLHRRRA